MLDGDSVQASCGRIEGLMTSRILKISFFSFLGLILLPAFLAHAQAPTSQPSIKKGAGITSIYCGDPWKQGEGQEAECTIQTGMTTWTFRYYLEGDTRLTLKGRVKNLLVLFHPDGFNHLARDWWGALIGPEKAIDTERYMILSIGNPADGNPPKTGNPIFLTMDEILAAQKAVIDYLFHRRTDFIVAGPSSGGINAFLYAIKYPDDIKKAFLVTAHPLYPEGKGEDVEQLMEKLQRTEMQKGIYQNWDRATKIEFWRTQSIADVETGLSEAFFQKASNMKDVGLDPKDFKNAEQFKKTLIQSWAEGYADSLDPSWLGAISGALDEGMKAVKPEDYKNLPKDMLVVYNKLDLTFKPEHVEKFGTLVKKERRGSRIKLVEVEDDQGHSVCCSLRLPKTMPEAIAEFLD